MIISRQKEFNELCKSIKERDIFIIGCGKCAAKLHAGGEPEVLEMKKKLKCSGKNIVGWTILGSACNISSWSEVVSHNPAMARAEALLVMSCGGGVSVVSALTELEVYPALDTESLGGMCRDALLREQCILCGECDIHVFGGICPAGRCPKNMRNGPCGGAVDGKCEVDEGKCVWDEIYERLSLLGRTDSLIPFREPKDHSRRRKRI